MTLKFAGNPSFDPLRELRYKNKTKKVCGGGEGGGDLFSRTLQKYP